MLIQSVIILVFLTLNFVKPFISVAKKVETKCNYLGFFDSTFLKGGMDEIIKNKLYLGNMFDANDTDTIKNNTISCIVCVAERLKIINTNPNVTVHKYELADDYSCNISLYFDEIGEIINKGGIVLVNCAAGISRSSTIVIAYIMKYYKLNLKTTFLYVKKKRNQICPNKKFMECLLDYELALFGKNSLSYDECIKLFYYT